MGEKGLYDNLGRVEDPGIAREMAEVEDEARGSKNPFGKQKRVTEAQREATILGAKLFEEQQDTEQNAKRKEIKKEILEKFKEQKKLIEDVRKFLVNEFKISSNPAVQAIKAAPEDFLQIVRGSSVTDRKYDGFNWDTSGIIVGRGYGTRIEVDLCSADPLKQICFYKEGDQNRKYYTIEEVERLKQDLKEWLNSTANPLEADKS